MTSVITYESPAFNNSRSYLKERSDMIMREKVSKRKYLTVISAITVVLVIGSVIIMSIISTPNETFGSKSTITSLEEQKTPQNLYEKLIKKHSSVIDRFNKEHNTDYMIAPPNEAIAADDSILIEYYEKDLSMTNDEYYCYLGSLYSAEQNEDPIITFAPYQESKDTDEIDSYHEYNKSDSQEQMYRLVD